VAYLENSSGRTVAIALFIRAKDRLGINGFFLVQNPIAFAIFAMIRWSAAFIFTIANQIGTSTFSTSMYRGYHFLFLRQIYI